MNHLFPFSMPTFTGWLLMFLAAALALWVLYELSTFAPGVEMVFPGLRG